MPGTHGGRHGDLAQVAALGGARLQSQDLVHRGEVVLRQLLGGEGRLADDEVQVGVPVHPELDLAALDVGHRLGDVDGHRAGLRVRHQAARTEGPAQPADLAHQVRGGHDGVEVEVAAGHLLDQLVGTDLVGTGVAGRLGPVTGGEDQHPRRLAGAVGQVDRAADHLVGLARVDAEPHRDVDGLVELGAWCWPSRSRGPRPVRRACPPRPCWPRRRRTCCASSAGSFHQVWCGPRWPSHVGFSELSA